MFLLVNLDCLEDSYEEKRVFVGADLEMSCNISPTSGTLFKIEWRLISGVNNTLICSSVAYGRCGDIDGHILDVQKKLDQFVHYKEHLPGGCRKI